MTARAPGGRRPLRLGLLSTARINGAIIRAARANAACEVVAVASRDTDRARRYAAEHGIPRAHGSYEALLDDADVEAVYVSLPNSLHVPWSVRALDAGKHVLCEKPLTSRAADAEAAFDASERAGRLLMEGFMWRHHPQAALLESLATDGTIGELRLVRSAFTFTLTREADVRLRADLDGGALMDLGCYCVSASRLLAGEPESVFAEAVRAEAGVDIRVAATMRFAGDVVAHFDAAFDLPGRSFVEVVGSGGSMLVSPAFSADDPVVELRRGGDVEQVAVEPADRFALQLENFAAAARGESQPRVGRSDAVGQARALEALLRSAEVRAPVAV